MKPRVKAVKTGADYRLRITFSNGEGEPTTVGRC